MKLTPEHEQLRQTLKRYIDTEINPYVDEWEEAEIFPAHQVFKGLGDLGLLGVTKPVEYGGMGLDWSYGAVVAETLGFINCGAIPMAIGVQTDMATPALARFGSDAAKEDFLKPSITGDYVACLGVSEVGAGSDVASVKTTAKKDGDDYVINGGKMWTTNGTQADWMCLLANTSDDAPHRNKTLICLPLKDDSGKHRKGVEVARKLKKLGMKSSDTAQFYFEDVRVPQRYRIGEEGAGFMYQMLQFQEERLWGSLSGLLGMKNTINETIEYTRQRQVFGKSVLDNQVVHFRLAELMTEVEALRALTWEAVEKMINGEDVTLTASMAKLKAGRLLREVNDSCLQYWGGMGFMEETLVSRSYRDGRLASIGAGADEVMLSIICKYMGILPGKTNRK
ncbi:MAG TPA: acyl-CoA dehydrogenase family protein [Parvularculaceae bacterium]|nr:acyl-CoA dehydrogenase family protein [Amphiplicatus sp.]MCB9954805.1 acyl-CoA dehydrogenase family protein [Caulobacterales bacterium]HPE29590.1 acyl-CoA dehydrogenase family protein [Parvularculaceae bacterium]HRX39325.1 acyl-CoA dehydrogenase family protein [Parvularculaceae bacterium]